MANSIVPVPNVPINFVPAKAGETFSAGGVTFRILEDGSRTNTRLGMAEIILPPRQSGPPPHWHEMHDESFLVTQGVVRFHVPDPDQPGKDKKTIDANVGDYVCVPPRAPHTFSNPSDAESRLIFTTTPSFYINYFRLLAQLGKPDQPMPAEVVMQAMHMYATIQIDNMPRKNQ